MAIMMTRAITNESSPKLKYASILFTQLKIGVVANYEFGQGSGVMGEKAKSDCPPALRMRMSMTMRRIILHESKTLPANCFG
jgi:hypothetical protein